MPPSRQATANLHFQFYAAKPADGAGAADGGGAAGGGLRVLDVPAVDALPESGEQAGLSRRRAADWCMLLQ